MHHPQPEQHPAPGLRASPFITGQATPTAKPPGTQVYSIGFTGSGSEYFRVWIVNVLLLLVTLGLYYPWAKVRKLRYFYGNTVVAGHPLDFHGDPRQMLRGFLLVGVLMGLYSFAGQVSPLAGGLAFLIVAALWPALMRASLQFRLANTSWRGLRFSFAGSLKDAYMVVLMPVAVFAGMSFLSTVVGGLLPSQLGAWRMLTILPVVLTALAMGPYVWWRLKRYQHSNYVLGHLQSQYKGGFGSMLGVFVRTSLITLGCLAAAVALAALLTPAGSLEAIGSADQKDRNEALGKWVTPMIVGMFLLAQLVQGPYFVSRMQNLVWTQTGNRQLRFKSHLSLGPLAWLTFKNWALTLITLGFYWPFAAVALARIKLASIEVHSRLNPDQLATQVRIAHRDAAGELAADMMGMDFGI